MAKRLDKQNTTRKPDSLNATEFSEVLSSNFHLDAARKKCNDGDDLIVSLANRRENVRARQVFEWESARRNTLAQTNRQNAA